MRIESVNFGTIEVAEDELVTFEQGLLGLEAYKRYAIVRPDDTMPIGYLQAADEPEVCLLLADPFAFQADYEFDLPEPDAAALQRPQPGEVAVWVTVSARDNTLEKATMNLLAPIVFNTAKRLGRQAVLHDSGYPTRVPLFPVQKEGE